MVFITGHDEERDPGIGLFYDVHGVFEELFEDVQFFGDTDIKAAFRSVAAEAGSHTSGEK